MHRWDKWRNDKKGYASNYQMRSDWEKERVDYTCQHCGVRQGEVRMNKHGRFYKVVVHAAHVNHDPHNPHAELIVLCSACHKRYDADEHGRKGRSTHYRKQREAQIQAGQLELFALGRKR
jgi:hypothetical protein